MRLLLFCLRNFIIAAYENSKIDNKYFIEFDEDIGFKLLSKFNYNYEKILNHLKISDDKLNLNYQFVKILLFFTQFKINFKNLNHLIVLIK